MFFYIAKHGSDIDQVVIAKAILPQIKTLVFECISIMWQKGFNSVDNVFCLLAAAGKCVKQPV